MFTAYRATFGSVKVAKNRRTATVAVSCPSLAPKGCLVVLDGVVAGKKAFAQKAIVVMRNVKQTITVKLTSVVANRLKKKGGSLKVTARTRQRLARVDQQDREGREAAQEGHAQALTQHRSMSFPPDLRGPWRAAVDLVVRSGRRAGRTARRPARFRPVMDRR